MPAFAGMTDFEHLATGLMETLYSKLLLAVVVLSRFLGQMRDRRGHESK
jgi:hypothetical protein